MKKSKTEDGSDVYEPENKEEGNTVFYDARDNKSVTPTVAVEFDGKGESKMVCLICKLKTTDTDEFLNHKCQVEGDEKRK